MGGFLSREHDLASSPEVDLEEANRLSGASIYSDLKHGFIRFITILPSLDRHDSVECVLEECPLANSPPYKALSYTWGSKSNPGAITVNDKSFLVTRNLLVALLHLRALGFRGPLWIDAICINQIDIPERESQVEQMRTIYANAALVLVWLGPRADKSDSVMQMLSEAEAHSFSSDWISTLLHNSTYEDHFQPLADLLLRSYWERVWIVQEIAYAIDALILCGLRQISYLSLLKFLNALNEHAIDEAVSRSQIGRIIRLFLPGIGPATLMKPGSARLGDYQDPVLRLRMHAVTKKCRDPRDKVYGTYGLFGLDLRQRIKVDYSKSTDEVMKTVAKAVIDVTHRLDILCVQARLKTYPLGSWQDKLPSWVPTWDARTENELCVMITPEYHFFASGSTDARCQYLQGNTTLQATGLLVGQITKILPRSLGTDRWLYGDEDDLIKLVQYTISCRLSLGDQVESPRALAAFWSTLFCGWWEWTYFPRGRAMYGENWPFENIFQVMVNVSNDFDYVQNLVKNGSGMYQTFNSVVRQLWRTPLFNQYEVATLENLYRAFKGQLFFHFKRAEGMERAEVDTTAQSDVPPFDIGVCPDSAQEGDYICVLLGCKTPVLLRPVREKFKFVGSVYVTGFMYGEALKGIGDSFEGTREFLIE